MITYSTENDVKLKGLSDSEVKNQLSKYGYNELPTSTKKNVIDVFIEVMREPMFILLVSSAVIYVFLGDYREGLILLSATTLIIFITFFQYRKAENALAALSKLSSPQALVYRNNTHRKIPGREVVPNDIVFLNEGDRAVADAILIEGHHLWMDEAVLTGESIPVTKTAVESSSISYDNIQIDRNGTHIVYAGTLVVQGSGIVKIVSTGVASRLGKIGIALKDIKYDPTRLQIEMKALINRLFFIGVIISIIVILAYYVTRGGIINALLNGISTSMAVLPEEFPVVLTVFLAIGSWRLSKFQVLTRKPSAIETLGAVTVLCVDKTGTITMNSMEIAFIYDGINIFSKDQLKLNASETFELIQIAKLASAPNGVNPMENAILKTVEDNPEIKEIYPFLETNRIVQAYPLTNSCPSMTNIYASKDDNEFYVFSKGAPEHIFKLCGLDDIEVEMHEDMLHSLALQSLRVIAIATARYTSASFPTDQSELKLNFKGLIAFQDPIRPEVPKAINECRAAGVKVKIITGDFPVTAKSIANQIGIDKEGIVLTGDELEAMSDSQLLQKMNSISVFARVIPSQKLRIVNLLKMQNEVVAMTGDGVNDAPALKAAHIGIAMGKRGTEVAREAASLVLLDDNFTSIVAAIRQGRKIFDNLEKAMGYILAIHIPIIGLTLLPVLFPSVPFILMPLHIISLELVIDPISSIAFETETEEKNIMNRPPRNATSRFFGSRKIIVSVTKGVCLFISVLFVLMIGKFDGLNDQAIRTTCYTALVLGNSILILNSLSKTRPFYFILKNKNWAAIGILIFSITLLYSAINFSNIQSLFKFQHLGVQSFYPIFLATCVLLTIFELQKYFARSDTNYNQRIA
jgi:Ca2+-transporting ATPase